MSHTISTANIANDPHFTPLTNADLSEFSCGQHDSTQTKFYSNGEEKDELAHSLACAHAHNRKTAIHADPGFWSRHQCSRGAVESDR